MRFTPPDGCFSIEDYVQKITGSPEPSIQPPSLGDVFGVVCLLEGIVGQVMPIYATRLKKPFLDEGDVFQLRQQVFRDLIGHTYERLLRVHSLEVTTAVFGGT